MDAYIRKDYWVQHVQDFKDSESAYGISKYDAAQLAQSVLRYIRYTRIRQFNLFSQKRGEEYEKMIELLHASYAPESVHRFLDDDDLWKLTLELGTE